MTDAADGRDQHHPNPGTSLVAGGVAGAVAKTVVAPLDRVKILYQVSKSDRFTLAAAARSAVQIVRGEGVLGLWKGHTATLLRIVPYAAIQYSCFEQLQRIWAQANPPDIHDAPPLHGISSWRAPPISPLLIQPDLLRTRMAVDQQHPVRRAGHLHKMLAATVRERGLRGLYRGMVPTLIGIVPYAGTSFWTFETLKSVWIRDSDQALRSPDRLVMGACAGLLAQSASYPLETIRRRMQVVSRSRQPLISLVADIYRQEGIVRGLYKGLSMNWIKGPIATGLSFTVYDAVKTRLSSS